MDEQLFQEYDTVTGQFQVRLNRFKGFLRSNWKVIAPFVVIACAAGYFVVSHVTQATTVSAPKNNSSGGQGHNNSTPSANINPNPNYFPNKTGHLLYSTSTVADEIDNDENGIIFIGNETFRNFTDLSDVEDPLNVSSITLRHLELHGPSFTESLEVFRNLQILRLENVTILELSLTKRVTLPKLKYFSVSLIENKYEKEGNKSDNHDVHDHKHETAEKSDKTERKNKKEEKSAKHGHRHEKEDKSDTHDHNHEKPKNRQEILVSVLFFQKTNVSWDFDKDLANLDVEIRVKIDGSKLLTIAQNRQELMLNFPNCEKILKNLKWPPKILTLAGCSKDSVFHLSTQQLHYLNMNNVSMDDGELAEVIKKQPLLTELLLNIPNGTLDLADVPKSVKFLSLSGMKVKVNSKKHQGHGFKASSIREFTMSDGVLEENLASNLKTVLPEAETVALFNMKHSGSRRKLLRNIMKTEASRIIVGNLTTISSTEDEHFENGTLTVDGEEVDEGYLEGIGIPKHSKHFMIMFPPKGDSDSQVGIPLNVHETRFFHFTLSEKNKVMTFQEYLKVVAKKP